MFSNKLMEEHVLIAGKLSKDTTTSAPTVTKKFGKKNSLNQNRFGNN
jgi:hypothetical protein